MSTTLAAAAAAAATAPHAFCVQVIAETHMFWKQLTGSSASGRSSSGGAYPIKKSDSGVWTHADSTGQGGQTADQPPTADEAQS